MKNTAKLFAIALVVLGSAATSFAQGTSATATASATIVTPIAITKDIDLNFGNVAVNNTIGTVALDASVVGTRTAGGGVTLPAVTGAFKAAKFTVTGTSGYLYTFSIPATATTVNFGSETMTVDSWTKSTSGTLTGGSEVVYVGATLHVGAAQPAGEYVSTTPFTVTVDYN